MKINLGPYPEDNLPRQEEIQIDPWDSWNAGATLAKVDYPLLVQLKATKKGYALVDHSDASGVPLTVREDCYGSNVTEMHWDFVLDEIIYAMKEISEGEPGEDKFYDTIQGLDLEGIQKYQARLQNGCRLFGKYFQDLWD